MHLIAALCVGVWKTFGDELKTHITGAGGQINDTVGTYKDGQGEGGG